MTSFAMVIVRDRLHVSALGIVLMAPSAIEFLVLLWIMRDEHAFFIEVHLVIEANRAGIFLAAARPSPQGRMPTTIVESGDMRMILLRRLQIAVAADAGRVSDAHQVAVPAMLAMTADA